KSSGTDSTTTSQPSAGAPAAAVTRATASSTAPAGASPCSRTVASAERTRSSTRSGWRATAVTSCPSRAYSQPIWAPIRPAPQALVEAVLERAGRLDVVVNNAAAFRLRPFGEFTVEEIDQLLAVNVRAVLLLVQAALPALRRSPAPAVVNVSSAAGVMYRPGQAVYGLTKAALEHVTKQLAAELAPEGIRVNAIRPGPTDTPIHQAV